jgi:hypothetical protein
VAITVDHQPREDNTVAHRDRLHRQREVFERDYKDGDTDVRGDSVRDATGGERRSAP